jgi:hypothetical protein
MSDKNTGNISFCVVKSIGCAGSAFLVTAQAVDNLVMYFFGPGAFWLITSFLFAGAWGLEYFCIHEKK